MINRIPLLPGYDAGSGVCRYLKNSLCEIYEKRPSVCNVEKMYDLYFKAGMTEIDFVLENLNACLRLAEMAGDYAVQEKLANSIGRVKNSPKR